MKELHHHILAIALTAKQEANWLLVNECLQKLSLEQNLPSIYEEQIIDLAKEVFIKSSFEQRWEVAKLFPKLGTKALTYLIEIVENPAIDPDTRWLAIRNLGEFNQSQSIITLVKVLQQTEDEELSSAAVQALANIGDSAIETLKNLVQNSSTRLLAIQALAHLRHPTIIDTFLQVIDDPNPQIRALAIEALSNFNESRILPFLFPPLQDSSAQVRKQAVITLGRITPPNLANITIDHIKPLLFDLNLEVCQQAAIALGRIGTNQSADALFPVLKSLATPLWLKLVIVRSMSWIKTLEVLDYFREALRWGDKEVCQEIINVLGYQELSNLKVKATHILIEFFSSEQKATHLPQIKQSLAMSLGELRQAEAINLLQQLAHDSETTVKLHGVAALKKFGITDI